MCIYLRFHTHTTGGHLSNDLWKLFKLVELTQVMCQTDKYFIEMPNKIQFGKGLWMNQVKKC